MHKYFRYGLAFLFIVSIAGCKSYSKYTIDDHATVKIDTGLFGAWKAVEDTDKANFILIQSSLDLLAHIIRWNNLDSAQKLAIVDSAAIRAGWDRKALEDSERIKMVFFKDTAMDNKYYSEYTEQKDYYYYITYFNMHGTNPLYQQWGSFLSKISDATFLNIPYNYLQDSEGHFLRNREAEGYFFVRLIHINAAHDSMTTAIVADTSLKSLISTTAVRNRITKNMNNRDFYSDTVHFYKVNNYHLSLNDAIIKANK